VVFVPEMLLGATGKMQKSRLREQFGEHLVSQGVCCRSFTRIHALPVSPPPHSLHQPRQAHPHELAAPANRYMLV